MKENFLMIVILFLLIFILFMPIFHQNNNSSFEELNTPNDFQELVNMGISDGVPYVVYRTKDGEIKMKRYVNSGFPKGEYILKKVTQNQTN